jgi:hypothetical protein
MAAPSAAADAAAAAMMQQQASMQAQGQEMHNTILQLQHQLNESEARRHQLESAAASQSSSQGPVVRQSSSVPRRPEIPRPSPFAGTGGATIVDDFIHSVEKQFEYMPESFPSEKFKVEYASSYLAGSAAKWYINRKDELHRGGSSIETWSQLASELRARFQPIGSALVARQSLDAYKQLGSAQNYIDHFLSDMAHIADMSVSDQIHRFAVGLKKEIRIEVYKYDPQTLNDAIACAARAERYLQLGAGATSHQSSSFGAARSRDRYHHPSSSSSASTHTNMELSSMLYSDDHSGDEAPSSDVESTQRVRALETQLHQTEIKMHSLFAMFGRDREKSSKSVGKHPSSSDARVSGVSKEDFARCRAEGRCLNCHQTGHVARECTHQRSLKW